MNTNNNQNIIIVDDDDSMRDALFEYFYRANYFVKTYHSGIAMLAEIENYRSGVVICDLKMPKMNGIDILKKLKKYNDRFPLIMITAHGNVPTAVESIRNGAYDFIEKPFDLQVLRKRVEYALSTNQTKLNHHSETKNQLDRSLLGKNHIMMGFKRDLYACINATDNILLTGEQGVNKLLVAREIHRHSKQAKQNFVHIDCAIVSEVLFAKFFTEEDNVFNKAKEGVVFLENINKLPVDNKSKLLNLLNNKNLNAAVNKVRILSSINDKTAIKKQHETTLKLYEKLQQMTLYVPALHERKNDIPELFNLYLAKFASQYQTTIPVLTEADIIAVSTFDWLGNQQQLMKIVKHFILLNRTSNVSISDLLRVSPIDILDINNKLNSNLRLLIRDFECQLITQALIECHGNITQVCDLLKTPRRTLNEKLLKHNLNRLDFI